MQEKDPILAWINQHFLSANTKTYIRQLGPKETSLKMSKPRLAEVWIHDSCPSTFVYKVTLECQVILKIRQVVFDNRLH